MKRRVMVGLKETPVSAALLAECLKSSYGFEMDMRAGVMPAPEHAKGYRFIVFGTISDIMIPYLQVDSKVFSVL